MSELNEALEALLELESSMKAFYDGALKKSKMERLNEDLSRIRDQEIGHVRIVKEMLTIVKENNA